MKRLTRPTILALAIIALGFGLRLYRLDAQSFWYDEAYSASVASGTPAQIIFNYFNDVHPPLYYLVLHLWQMIDDSDFTLRLLSAMLGTAGIAALYALGKATFDQKVGLAAAAITCLAPYTVFYGQEARMYSLLLLLSSMLLLSYNRMLDTGSTRWWLAYTACATLSLYVQYISALLLLGLHLHFFVTHRRDRRPWVLLATGDILALLTVAPQLAIFVAATQRVSDYQWPAPQRPGIASLLSAPYALTLSQFTTERLVPLAFAVVLLLLMITHLQLARHMVRAGDKGGKLTLLLCALWTPLLTAFALSQWQSIYRERALIVMVPALYLLLSWGATRTKERYFNLVALLLLGAFAVGGLHNWYFDPGFSKPPFRFAAHSLPDFVEHDEPILHTSDAAFLLFMRYAPQYEHYLIAGDPTPHMPIETYRLFGGEIVDRNEVTASQLCLVVALEHSIEFQREVQDWFDQHFVLVDARNFDGVILRLYESDGPQAD
jgi:4-amino-4-deoxy-L-arabinose transferase-like glycosyltransferase